MSTDAPMFIQPGVLGLPTPDSHWLRKHRKVILTEYPKENLLLSLEYLAWLKIIVGIQEQK